MGRTPNFTPVPLLLCGAFALPAPPPRPASPAPPAGAADAARPPAQEPGAGEPKGREDPEKGRPDGPRTEFVMTPGMRITATTPEGTIAITADDELTRSFTWEGATRSVEMLPRHERWYGSLGIYYPGPGYHWKEHNGISRCVAEEGQRHFKTTAEAIEWLEGRRPAPLVHTSDGLVVSWGKTLPRKQLDVEVWQILIDGRKPKDLPGGDDEAIVVSEVKPESPGQFLVEAVRKGDVARVRTLLEEGADPDTRAAGSPVLSLAAEKGDADIVQALLDKEADPNARGDKGATPLVEAAFEGRVAIMKALLAKGADPEVPIERGMIEGATALFVAAMQGDPEAVGALLEAGADVNKKKPDGETPLHSAAMFGNAEAAELLLRKGAEVDARDWLGATPLIKAAMQGSLDVAKLLVSKGANVNARTDRSRAMYGAYRFSGRTEEAEKIEKSGRLDTLHEDGQSALDWADASENKELIAFLKQAGAK